MTNRTPWNPSIHLGQGADLPMSEAERNAILAQIDDGLSKVGVIDDLIAWSASNDPNLQRTLGADAARFFRISNEIAPLFPMVQALYDRLSSEDATDWVILDPDELPAVEDWTRGIADMYAIYTAHRPGRDIPVQIQVPVPVPYVVPTSVPPQTIIIQEPSLLGVPQSQLLIGGAVAIAATALVLILT